LKEHLTARDHSRAPTRAAATLEQVSKSATAELISDIVADDRRAGGNGNHDRQR
jgi:hypothetical protein